MRIRVLQHASFEGPGKIQDWAVRAGHTLETTRLYAHEALPKADAFDMLVILGGPMSANDDARHPWLKGEKLFLELAIERGKKVLGVCLGAQLIARVLGAKVYPNPEKEIGWFPIELNPSNARFSPLQVLPQRVTVFHWHGETFDLPKEARHLARSRACENQAFAFQTHVIGLQFHLELGLPQIESLLHYAAADMTEGRHVMAMQEILDLAPSQSPPLQAALFRLLDGFTATG